MGNSQSSPYHALDVSRLNKVVGALITSDNTFLSSEYNFLDEAVCEKYQILIESELHKQRKIDLVDLGQAVYLLPSSLDSSALKVRKQELCTMITRHYMQVLYLLSMIKEVYDLEVGGEHSIGAVILKNVRHEGSFMEINFCEQPHKDYSMPAADKVSSRGLTGVQRFIDIFLEKEEASEFVALLKAVLARKPDVSIQPLLCKFLGDLATPADQRNLSEVIRERNPAFKCGGDKKKTKKKAVGGARAARELQLFINKNNPIFSDRQCYNKRKIVIDIKTKEGKQMLAMHNNYVRRYNKNIEAVAEHVLRLVDVPAPKAAASGYRLKNLASSDVAAVAASVKASIKTLYIQCILDYQNMIDRAQACQKLLSLPFV
jgi:hypothetical protein